LKIESEKTVQRNLRDKVKAVGGWCIKLVTIHISGLPDCLCLLPGAKVFFAEVKTTKKKPEKLQITIMTRLEKMGFGVYVIDQTADIDPIIQYEILK